MQSNLDVPEARITDTVSDTDTNAATPPLDLKPSAASVRVFLSASANMPQ